jgi:di/tripeptidase
MYAKGDVPILLVAHLDTVHTTLPREIFFDANQRVYFSPQGIGADDRAGVWAILQLIKYRPHILFTCDEEIGCVGANDAVKNMNAPKVKYIVEFDRAGSNDMVFYDCDNPAFTGYIETFGFKEAIGSFSDISKICPAWKIAGVNLSTGYYGAHTLGEYLRIDELNIVISKVAKMIKDLDSAPYFEYIKSKWDKGYSSVYGHDWYEHYKSRMKTYGVLYCEYCGKIVGLNEESCEAGMCKECFNYIVKGKNKEVID